MGIHAQQESDKSRQKSSETEPASETAKDATSVRSPADAKRISAWTAMAYGDGLPPGLVLQAKLTVSQPGDVYEQEADQVAEQVMRMASPEASVSNNEDETQNSLMCKQSKGRGADAPTGSSHVPSIVHTVLDDRGGQPLDTETRTFMEPRFGHDFSQVRVHTDERAAETAQAVNALAYTVGEDVVFRAGQYTPGTSEGKRLIAHELTHTLQQGANGMFNPAMQTQSTLAVPGTLVQRQSDDSPDASVTPTTTAAPPSAAELDQQYQDALQLARRTGDWQNAAKLLNGFNHEDIQLRLAQMTIDEIGYLHQGALDNPQVGPQSQVALLTKSGTPLASTAPPPASIVPLTPSAPAQSVSNFQNQHQSDDSPDASAPPTTTAVPLGAAKLDQQYQDAIQSALGADNPQKAVDYWMKAAELLNGFNHEDILDRLAKRTTEEIGNLHQGALNNARVGPQSQVALLTGPGIPLASTDPSSQSAQSNLLAVDPKIAQLPWNRYVDVFDQVDYDLDYRREGGNLSEWLRVHYSDGSIIDIHINDIVEESMTSEDGRNAMAQGRVGNGSRIFPQVMNSRTTPRLWRAKQEAIEIMEESNIQFMMASLPAVIFIITMPMSVVGNTEPAEELPLKVNRTKVPRQNSGRVPPTSEGEPPSAISETDIERLTREGKVDQAVLKKLALESWRKGGRNQLVKVVSSERGATPTVRGYVTQLKFVEGRTTTELEKILGLPEGELDKGAIIERLDQLPNEGQFELRGYTQRPDGKAYVPGDKYPPGLGAPQWQVTEPIPATKIGEVKPGDVFHSTGN